jgi:hypothetical protein
MSQEQEANPPTPIDRTSPLPPTLHLFSTNHQEHPRTPRKKDKNRMHTMSKLLEKDKAMMSWSTRSSSIPIHSSDSPAPSSF